MSLWRQPNRNRRGMVGGMNTRRSRTLNRLRRVFDSRASNGSFVFELDGIHAPVGSERPDAQAQDVSLPSVRY